MMVKGYSITGTKHISNQDGFFMKEEPGKPYIYMAADGMGGHAAGDIAAKTAINIISGNLNEFSKEAIQKAINEANTCILEKSKSSAELEGMGTTVVLCMRSENKVMIAHVGDSRAYVIEDGVIKYVTKDHSYVQQLVDGGEITAQEAKTHPMKNIITNAVGVQETVKCDIVEIEVNDNCIITLCSDGVSNVMTDEELAEISESKTENPARELCEKAQELDSRDDVTAIVINLRGDV